MKALVIYDSTGRIWNIIYGEETVPQGLTAMFVDIPDGAVLNHIDVTDPANPQPVFDYLPESDIGRLQKQIADLEDQLTETQLALCEQYEENLAMQEEVTNTQLAVCEVYEAITVTDSTADTVTDSTAAEEGGAVYWKLKKHTLT